MDAGNNGDHPRLKPPVVLDGTANEGRAGPPIGIVDIGVSEDAYLFRVALPGIRKDPHSLSCDIERDGKVQIHGVVADSGILENSSSVYQMSVQQLCPPGPFTVSFSLPGPVDPRLFKPTFRADGILEGVVIKFKFPPKDGQSPPT
ncbi:hypothetical protein ACOSQ2_011644 [Xanthoceras sorbifolium]